VDRYLLSGAVLLLILQTTWLLDDLKIINVGYFSYQKQSESGRPIGEVLESRQNVKRRAQNSLVWEESSTKDLLYYYDSVLTLHQSAATLKVEADTQVHLSENTLVVLEPSSNSQVDRLRLVFMKGDMRARNPNRATLLETSSWTIDTQKGSEINVRSTSDGKMELEVLKGAAELNHKFDLQHQDTSHLSKGQVVTLTPEKIEDTKALSSSLKWHGPNNRRAYSHHFPYFLSLSWDGPARQLVLEQQDGLKRTLNLNADQKSQDLELRPGLYHVKLLGDQQTVSSTLKLEIWQAPVIHLLAPFPRDRIPVALDTRFTWTAVPEASSYVLQFSEDQSFKKPFASIPTHNLLEKKSFDRETFLFWRVQGMDADGITWPALYSNPIFVVDNPLQAPHLKPVHTRRPASKPTRKKERRTSFLENVFEGLVASVAHAEPADSEALGWEADFEWEAVDGANHYVIEISSTPNFQETLKSQSVHSPRFTWKNMRPGTYYWRVAAVKPDGQVGLFSEVAEAVLNENAVNPASGVTLRKVPAPPVVTPPSPPPPTATPMPKPLPTPPLTDATPEPFPTPDEENPDPETHTNLWVGPGVVYSAMKAENAKAQMIGPTLFNAGFVLEKPHNRTTSYLIFGQFSYSRWKPTPIAEYPFQNTLIDFSGRVSAYDMKYKHSSAWGLSVTKASVLTRTDPEQLDFTSAWLLGPAYLHRWQLGLLGAVTAQVSLTTEISVTDLGTTFQALRSWDMNKQNSLEYGWLLGLDGIYNSNGLSLKSQVLLILGLKWN